MENSCSNTKKVACNRCKDQFVVEEWQIIDTEDRLDLLEKLGDESINEYYCPTCGAKGHNENIILIYRPNKDYPIVFRIPDREVEKDDQETISILLSKLQKQLGIKWNEKWNEKIIYISQYFFTEFVCDQLELRDYIDSSENIEIILPIFGELSIPGTIMDMDRRISLCVYGLQNITREKHPILWASLNNEAGVTLINMENEDEIEKSKTAINLFIRSQEVWTKDKFPKKWAMMNSNIGSTLYNLLQKKIIQDYEAPVKYWLQALEVFNENDYPFEYIQTHRMIASAYIHIPFTIDIGEIAKTQLSAIHHLESAQKLLSPINYPKVYKENVDELISVYENCIMVHRSLIFTIKLLPERVPENVPPEIYYKTALLYFQLCCLKNSKENIEKTILFFDNALEIFDSEKYSERWAEVNLLLAKVYIDYYEGDEEEKYKRAIYYFDQALQFYKLSTSPSVCCEIFHNLGRAYIYRPDGIEESNIERCIHYLEQATELCDIEQNPEVCAVIRIELGVAYLNRILGNRSENIEKAIDNFEQTLNETQDQTMNKVYTDTALYLGRALVFREKGIRTENLERAVALFEQVLKFYTQQEYPFEWAKIQEELGNTFLELSDEQI